jgi:hypothetical protein
MGHTSAIAVPQRQAFVVVVLEKVLFLLQFLPVPAQEEMTILVAFDD